MFNKRNVGKQRTTSLTGMYEYKFAVPAVGCV